MAYRLIFISFCFISIRLFSQNYPAEIISHDTECLVDEKNKLTVTKSLLIQINSPLGREHAQMQIDYDNNSSIKSIVVKILTNKYALIRSLKSKEIEDYSALTRYFHTDDRYKLIKAFHNTYPYLIEIKYIQEFKEFFSFPTWYPQNEENIPLQKSSYTLTVPSGYTFHQKFYNFNPEEHVQKTETTKTYKWQIVNLAHLNVQESFLPSIKSLYPTARFVPDAFVFGKIKGTSTTWKQVGNWYSKLISGLDKLPEFEIKKVLELTKQATNDYEKAKLIYTYLQNETRYIGVFIGIGGWKPDDATNVCNNKFGDCKALTNYMMAMLKAVGIKSYCSLIIADDDEPDIDTSFPGMYFNHVVLCVPIHNDTLWLECTNQSNPFNYWGTFTNGKHALVCDFENSYITQTPHFEHQTNYVTQTSKVIIQDGKLIVDMERQLFGEAFEKVKNNLNVNSDKEIIDIATKTLPFKNYSLTNVKYRDINIDGCTGYNETLQLTFSNNLQAYGSNLIISPFNKFVETQFHLNTYRQNPISILYNYKIADTTQYDIPKEFELEGLPINFQDSTRYGKVGARYIQEKKQLKVITFFEFNKGMYPQSDYADFMLFIDRIINSESHKILLKKL